eukprot:501007-Amphidinium_carterae.1
METKKENKPVFVDAESMKVVCMQQQHCVAREKTRYQEGVSITRRGKFWKQDWAVCMLWAQSLMVPNPNQDHHALANMPRSHCSPMGTYGVEGALLHVISSEAVAQRDVLEPKEKCRTRTTMQQHVHSSRIALIAVSVTPVHMECCSNFQASGGARSQQMRRPLGQQTDTPEDHPMSALLAEMPVGIQRWFGDNIVSSLGPASDQANLNHFGALAIPHAVNTRITDSVSAIKSKEHER